MDTTLKLSETKAFSKCQQVQWYAVLCNSIIMGVHLHVWVAWNKNQNKGAFTVPAPSFRDVMNRIVFFFCFFLRSFTFLFGSRSVRVLMVYLYFEEATCPQGMQLDVSSQQYIDTSVCLWLSSELLAGCGCLGRGRKRALQNPGWKFGNGSTGQNISPGCGCLWDSASLVHLHPAQPRWLLKSLREDWKWPKNDQCRMFLCMLKRIQTDLPFSGDLSSP